MPGTYRLVVAVEEISEAVVVHRVVREIPQDELFEEPGDVRAMPFRGTGVGHRLRDLVFGGESPGELIGEGADVTKSGGESGLLDCDAHARLLEDDRRDSSMDEASDIRRYPLLRPTRLWHRWGRRSGRLRP
jgi:hypothetical protein